MSRPDLHLVGAAPRSAIDAAREERTAARRHAAEAALEAIAFAAEAARRLQELECLAGDVPPCVSADAPLLARQMELALERMAASLRSDAGRIR